CPLGTDGRGVAIADVSGKGIPAALMMSNLQASLRAYCGRHSIADAVHSLNESVRHAESSGKFVTFFYAELDLGRGALRYTNAGHNYPLLRRADGTVQPLERGGLPLGIQDGGGYEV